MASIYYNVFPSVRYDDNFESQDNKCKLEQYITEDKIYVYNNIDISSIKALK